MPSEAFKGDSDKKGKEPRSQRDKGDRETWEEVLSGHQGDRETWEEVLSGHQGDRETKGKESKDREPRG